MGVPHDDHIMVGPPLRVMTLWGGPQEKEINGVPFDWYYGGSLMTMTLLGTLDYEIIGDIYDHEFNGVPYDTMGVPSWLWDYGRSIRPWD